MTLTEAALPNAKCTAAADFKRASQKLVMLVHRAMLTNAHQQLYASSQWLFGLRKHVSVKMNAKLLLRNVAGAPFEMNNLIAY